MIYDKSFFEKASPLFGCAPGCSVMTADLSSMILAEIRQLRQDLKASRAKLLTVDDVARELALSPKTIRNQLSAGTFPIRAVRSAGGVRFTRMSVEDYVRRLGEAE